MYNVAFIYLCDYVFEIKLQTVDLLLHRMSKYYMFYSISNRLISNFPIESTIPLFPTPSQTTHLTSLH